MGERHPAGGLGGSIAAPGRPASWAAGASGSGRLSGSGTAAAGTAAAAAAALDAADSSARMSAAGGSSAGGGGAEERQQQLEGLLHRDSDSAFPAGLPGGE
jgi:hypothetical protein